MAARRREVPGIAISRLEAACEMLRELRERTERLENQGKAGETERLLRETRAYAARRGAAFDPSSMSALLRALTEAARASAHPNARKWAFAASAFDAAVEAGPGDYQALVVSFVGDPEQAAIAELVNKWRKGQGNAGQRHPAPPPPRPSAPSQGPVSGIAADQCRTCEGYGHFARDCPSTRRRAQPRGPRGPRPQSYSSYNRRRR
ncbi:PREDICTED: uncharacterized protein LOC109473916 [Branchiostoma belcheri]|uniref:Uncharacterized protein LOC109473916 n=1 Tax=Branchiostoma belcheri TaxID=7741 RepID=A0A6P4YJN8_BRABE|nr:PREDICTED: uncharacterized protein LOC109473916 [Branchiostoma belcheri]